VFSAFGLQPQRKALSKIQNATGASVQVWHGNFHITGTSDQVHSATGTVLSQLLAQTAKTVASGYGGPAPKAAHPKHFFVKQMWQHLSEAGWWKDKDQFNNWHDDSDSDSDDIVVYR
jgi:hypothetical protein